MEDKLKKFVNENRDAFDRHVPSPEVWNRVKSQIEPPVKVKRLSVQWIWSAAAAVLVLFAVGSVWLSGDTDMDNGSRVAKKGDAQDVPYTKAPVEDLGEITKQIVRIDSDEPKGKSVQERGKRHKNVPMPTEKEENSETELALALLQDETSASRRIEGVLKMRELAEISPETMEQLQYAILHDPSSNVRLAAWELMMARTPESEWEQKIQDVFVQQDDLTLQMELMQVMAYSDSISITPATENRLQEITEDPLTMDLVKEQAYAVLMKNW